VLIISATGHVRRLATGYPDIGNLVWGPRAPAIAVQSTALAVELLFASGRRLALPKGWYEVHVEPVWPHAPGARPGAGAGHLVTSGVRPGYT
jgi:hypothetical protein